MPMRDGVRVHADSLDRRSGSSAGWFSEKMMSDAGPLIAAVEVDSERYAEAVDRPVMLVGRAGLGAGANGGPWGTVRACRAR